MLFGGIAAYVVFVEKERWRRVVLAVGSAVLFPYVSADYTMLHLLLPLALFLAATKRSPRDLVYAALFAVPLIPLDYVYFEFPALMRPVLVELDHRDELSVALYPLAIAALMALIVAEGLTSDGRERARRKARACEARARHRRVGLHRAQPRARAGGALRRPDAVATASST